MAEDKSLHTDAITSYDGIFKGMHDPDIRKKFFEIRGLLSTNKLPEAKLLLTATLEKAKAHPTDYHCLRQIQREIERYELYNIKQGTPESEVLISRVIKRPLQRLDEELWDFPQSVFFLDIGKPGEEGFRRFLGRKLLSDFWISGKIPELHCSLISASMILGLYVDQRITEEKVTVFYHSLEDGEKLSLMNRIMSSDPRETKAEVVFPFPLLRKSTKEELCSPPEGWKVDDAYDVMLGCGEERIRAYTVQFLKSVKFNSGVLYDPACSTGVFLSSLKEAFPQSHTFGQDLSQQMADVAKARLDEVHCGDALNPKIPMGTGNVVFNRFLNSEVVKSAFSEKLMTSLLPTLAPEGHMITFGHTPVLLSSAHFRMLSGYTLVQSVGIAPDKAGIFQYYVLKRT